VHKDVRWRKWKGEVKLEASRNKKIGNRDEEIRMAEWWKVRGEH
jgi:hypothetical protein